jgi:hypothetical protein
LAGESCIAISDATNQSPLIREYWVPPQRRLSLYHQPLSSGGEGLAHPVDLLALSRAQGKKLKAMAQSVAISHQRPEFDGKRRHRQRQFHGYDFPSLQFASQGCANAVFSKLIRSPPKRYAFSGAKGVYRDADIKRVARKAARCFGIRLGVGEGAAHVASSVALASLRLRSGQACRRSRGRIALAAAGEDARRTAPGTAALLVPRRLIPM